MPHPGGPISPWVKEKVPLGDVRPALPSYRNGFCLQAEDAIPIDGSTGNLGSGGIPEGI